MAFTSKDVMELRQRTGVGMMDCKKALVETDGDMEKAIDYLREKGIASAAKKQGRIASQGIVDSYIHMNGKIGVLLEVNCETDFAAELEKEREILIAQAKNEPNPKPDAIIHKMVDGRIQKYYKDVCLMEQVYVRDSSKTISQLVTEAIASIGEKITVRRFVRYQMGEGLQKREDNFAEEVMAQAGLNK